MAETKTMNAIMPVFTSFVITRLLPDFFFTFRLPRQFNTAYSIDLSLPLRMMLNIPLIMTPCRPLSFSTFS